METAPPPPERDLEFQPSPAVRSVGTRDEGPIEDYQRLVANPFLGIIGVCAGIFAARQLLVSLGPSGLVPTLALLGGGLIILPHLLHFHCLDCGQTGQLHRWQRHRCGAVTARRLAGRPRRIRGPTPWVQVLVWLYVLLAIGIVISGIHAVRGR